MAGAIYLADTSAYVVRQRSRVAGERFEALLLEGRLACCQMTALELLNTAPDRRGYQALWGALQGQRWADCGTAGMNRALEVHRELGRSSQHRKFKLPDLIIAATAELAGATVLHYDRDYDRIAAVTGQAVEWIVPRGSL